MIVGVFVKEASVESDISRRLGRFRIAQELLDTGDHDALLRLMCGCVVLRAQPAVADYYGDGDIEYLARAPFFDPLSQAEKIPQYLVTVTHGLADDGSPVIKRVEWART